MRSIVNLCLTIVCYLHHRHHIRDPSGEDDRNSSRARGEAYTSLLVSPSMTGHLNQRLLPDPSQPLTLRKDNQEEHLLGEGNPMAGNKPFKCSAIDAHAFYAEDQEERSVQSSYGRQKNTTCQWGSTGESTADVDISASPDHDANRFKRLIRLVGLTRFFCLSDVCASGHSPCSWHREAMREELVPRGSRQHLARAEQFVSSNVASKIYGNITLSGGASAHIGDVYKASPALSASAGSAVLTGVAAGAVAAVTNKLIGLPKFHGKQDQDTAASRVQQTARRVSAPGYDNHQLVLMDEAWERTQALEIPDSDRRLRDNVPQAIDTTEESGSPLTNSLRSLHHDKQGSRPTDVLQRLREVFEKDLTGDSLLCFRRKDHYQALQEIVSSRRCLKLIGDIYRWSLLGSYPELRYVVILSEHSIENDVLSYNSYDPSNQLGIVLFRSESAAIAAPQYLYDNHAVHAIAISLYESSCLFNISREGWQASPDPRVSSGLRVCQSLPSAQVPLTSPLCVMTRKRSRESKLDTDQIRALSFSGDLWDSHFDTFNVVSDFGSIGYAGMATFTPNRCDVMDGGFEGFNLWRADL